MPYPNHVVTLDAARQAVLMATAAAIYNYSLAFVGEEPRDEVAVIALAIRSAHYELCGLEDSSEETTTARTSIPDWLRQKVLERDEFRCLNCHATEGLSMDHVVPVSLGGAATIDNLQTLCGPCNSSKATDNADYRPYAYADNAS